MNRNDNPTRLIRAAVNELLRRNARTIGAVVGEMYLGPDIFVARLCRPRIIEGQWQDVPRPDDQIDLFDLIDHHQRVKP